LPLSRQQQRDVGQQRERPHQQILPLARDQRAHAKHYRAVEAQRRLGRCAIGDFECVEIHPGIMDTDLVRIHAHLRHGTAHRARHGEQPGGRIACLPHHCAGAALRPPMVDVRAARLDRIGYAQRARQTLRHRTVGEEEAGVDHVERALRMEFFDERQDGARHRPHVRAPTDLGDDRKGRAMDGQFAPAFLARQCAQLRILGSERQRPWRYAERGNHRHVGLRATGQFASLSFHEHAEIGTADVGKEGG
jgi:hypothetical protein